MKASLESTKIASISDFLNQSSYVINLVKNDFSNLTDDLQKSDNFKTFESKIEALTSSKKETLIEQEYIDNQLEKSILDFIKLIENSNAVTTMGTLEYVDRLSKFNLANVMCDQSTVDESKYTDILLLK